MNFDYNSILLASGASGIALCFTLAMSWLRQKQSPFLLTWSICIAIIIFAIMMFTLFQHSGQSWHAIAGGLSLTIAYALNYGGLTQFRDGRIDSETVRSLVALGAVPIVVPALFGFDGLSYIATNAAGAFLLALCGYHYWNMRSESPAPIGAISLLHCCLAFTYVLCALTKTIDDPLYLNGSMPNNWAEQLNLVVSVLGLACIGGLFITVHQERISRRLRTDSLIDPLTGLHNRRALFEHFAAEKLEAGVGLVVFDLDDFKGHNDKNGHAFGDMVLCAFSRLLLDTVQEKEMAVRLGGEEFVLVLPKSSPTHALAIAEHIRSSMGRRVFRNGDALVTCTVSAGVALAEDGMSLDRLIGIADSALYLSKRQGRNRVSQTTSTAA
ncbi:GGDEF domain-containing protein [Pelagibacterium lacus]|uniref:diguanylate cyclase n=1 Tax=Pelagibacterium lacus TaxID=2282655 RepID=A0A369W474_9HYPH|nr:diguanylate cyclase [Pelagibacterium lacus]RDE09123.1 sensor domain-containing diguanylate cyclase [Pelagibacterium lacus]